MGLRRDAKVAGNLGDEAQEAWDGGQRVFTPLLTSLKATGGSTAIDSWALAIDAIESVGWKLDQWSVTSLPSAGANFLMATPLFRR